MTSLLCKNITKHQTGQIEQAWSLRSVLAYSILPVNQT